MILVDIDEITPCLVDVLTGEVINTEVISVRKSILSNFTKDNGWYVDWQSLADTCEVYALVIERTYSFQGMIALHNDEDSKTAFIDWAVASPENNPLISPVKKYNGVGGHLFAIAAERSIKYGYEGAISGFAASMELVDHYVKAFNAEHIGFLHPYQVFIDEENGKKLREVYTYEWKNEL